MDNNIFESYLQAKLKQAMIEDGIVVNTEVGPAVKAFVKSIVDAMNNIQKPPCPGIAQKTPGKTCNYTAPCGQVCNKCGEVHKGTHS